MEGRPTPRQLAKGLLNGIAPPRPLFLPIVFSLGAKVENVPLDVFLNNPAKISSALRQMRGPLGADGVACYCSPYREVEALEEEANSGRVRVGAEVLRRMNAIPNRDFLLIACVTGPLTLATRVAQLKRKGELRGEGPAEEIHEVAASAVTQFATTFEDAGADSILIQEEMVAVQSEDGFESWAESLAPVINIVRFYEALPVLHLNGIRSIRKNWDAIFRRQWDCVVSLPMEVLRSEGGAGAKKTNGASLGISLPLEAFGSGGSVGHDLGQILQPMISELRPALVTTEGDVSAATDMKILSKVFGEVTRAL
jgi:hypothetical protein